MKPEKGLLKNFTPTIPPAPTPGTPPGAGGMAPSNRQYRGPPVKTHVFQGFTHCCTQNVDDILRFYNYHRSSVNSDPTFLKYNVVILDSSTKNGFFKLKVPKKLWCMASFRGMKLVNIRGIQIFLLVLQFLPNWLFKGRVRVKWSFREFRSNLPIICNTM